LNVNGGVDANSLIVGIHSAATVTSQLQMEANALLNSGWMNTTDEGFNISNRCDWPIITCNEVGSIKEINIDMVPYYYYTGTVLFARLNLSTFQNLERLAVIEHHLPETILKEICLLSKLTHLDLSGNYLKGQIPHSLGNLSKLTHLDLSNNFLEGQVPHSIANLRQLNYLDISLNFIKGSIPPELWLLKNLTFLDISNNRFKGEIPSLLGNLIQLVVLDISSNYIQGSIPLELEFLKNLTFLDLSNNRLKGEIPSSLGNLNQLQELDISHNNLKGSLPFELAFLKIIITLDLSHNRLSGNFPNFLTNLTQLEYLDISYNFLIGSLPSNFDQLTKLQVLMLNNNSVSGTFPISLTNLSQLETLDISHNLIHGVLPSKIFPFIDYKISIDLSHNLISGEIPSELGHFQSLILSNNNLTGTVPHSICNNVPLLNISYNYLRGPIPICVDPDIMIGNKDLCTNFSYKRIHFQFQPCPPSKKSNKVKSHVFKLRHSYVKNKQANTTKTRNGDLFCVWNYDGKIAFDDIIKATEDFDMRYCIGTGAYGSVYKAQLPCRKAVALNKTSRI